MEDLGEYVRRNRELLVEAFERGAFAKSLGASVERLLAAWREQREAATPKSALKTAVAAYTLYLLLQRVFKKSKLDRAAVALEEEDDALKGLSKCSFCIRKYTKQDIVAGPGVFICRECIELAKTALSHGHR